jgi:hypothetical protein
MLAEPGMIHRSIFGRFVLSIVLWLTRISAVSLEFGQQRLQDACLAAMRRPVALPV